MKKMLSLKVVFCYYLIESYVCGQIIQKHYSYENNSVGESTTLKISPNDIVLETQCPSNESLHSKNDIKVLIDYIYKQLSIDEQLSEAYKSQALGVRDQYIQDIKHFIEWFQHQPEHLKHVLEGLAQVRIKLIEPNVNKIAKLLHNYPQMASAFNEKNVKLRKLLNRQKRYQTMFSFNCGGMEDHRVKREIKNDYYCSSLAELNNRIVQKFQEIIEQMKTGMVNHLSIYNENYKESIDKIKNNLKDKALQKFGRTMYDILILQDEYHHFVEDLNITNLETEVFSTQELSIQIDEKLLQMYKVVENYGQHCRGCGEHILIRNTRGTNAHFEEIDEQSSEDIVDSLINVKFNETAIDIRNDWYEIFKDLNTLIHEVEKEDINLAHLKPIQEDVVKIINEERQKLQKLKSIAPRSTIKNVLDLVNQSKLLLKTIDESIISIEALINKYSL
ncbi:centromere-associated protein E-like [Nymphalis io]|uniref:centromere-associated protein E-like n=1 Tax=Inachis io TaxID=171585 RepID=UPI0021671AB2|nr:centromere-associated protein E-like [Nymphalis io]